MILIVSLKKIVSFIIFDKCRNLRFRSHIASDKLFSKTVFSNIDVEVNENEIEDLYEKEPLSDSNGNNIGELIVKEDLTDLTLQKQKSWVKDLENSFEKSETRYNVFGIQMLSKNVHKQLFKGEKEETNTELIDCCIANLKKYNLLNKRIFAPNVFLKLPPLAGDTLEDHFFNIAEEQSLPYKTLLISLLNKIPKVPVKWSLEPGWTRYTVEGIEKVDFPLEEALIFDVEVCCSEGDMPTLATAVSRKAWYGWVSDNVIVGSNKLGRSHYTIDQLISLESSTKARRYPMSKHFKKPRMVVGHNVSFDRARVKEQYWLEKTGLRFFDTLSMHVCVSGVTSYQKNLLKAGLGEEEWSKLSSLNSLSKVHKLYCGTEISKQEREFFITGSLSDIKNNFQTLMSYCAADVVATHSVFKELLPLFLTRFPHPATLAGMLEIQTAYVPLNSNWNRYLFESQQAYEDLDSEAKCLLSQSANEACHLMHDNCYKKDIWLWDQAWNSRHLKLTKKSKLNRDLNAENIFTDDRGFLENLSESSASTDDILNKLQINFDALFKKKHLLPLKIPHLPGYPAWYSKLCFPPRHNEWVPGPELISTGMQITPKLLQLTWNSLPLHYIKGNGWGYIVPYRSDIPIELEDMPVQELIKYCERFGLLCPCNTKEGDEKYTCRKLFGNVNSEIRNYFCKNNIGMSCGIIKLPHKDGGHLNVGNPLARDFINKFTGNELSGSCKYAHRVIEISRMLSYWRNNRDRIQNQLACWLNNKDLPLPLRSGQNIGAILPQVIVCGTLTRRAVEPTWMTASNAIVERVGSELRGIVQAPAGFSLVGADVDSQELWIASLLGDSHQAGIHGASPFGWMTLNGQKSDETDMHSVTAKVIGISRNHAKVLNYARIYGAGQKFAERLLRQFNPSMGANEANLKASKMYSMTKGSKIYKLKDNVLPEFKERIFHKASAHEVCTLYKKNLFDLFQPSIWVDGTESAMFNYLEEIAQKPSPETPFLRSKLSRALEPGIDNDDRHLPTRVNWVVQSGAVDFLHLMLVSMRWFLGPATRFCLSFHDEIRYLVHSEHKYKAALALHVTNLLTRSFCVKRLGMTDLPLSVAFFSSVEVDTVLRKESNDDNKTPSNPLGLLKGYGIPAGESLNIYEAIEKANGVIGIKK